MGSLSPRSLDSPPHTPQPTIVIVGGGFSGVMTAIHLMRLSASENLPLHLVLVERSAEMLAQGIAYNTRHSAHRLNVPAAKMSAFSQEPDHFYRWLCQQDPSAQPKTFAPRAMYGAYLADCWHKAIKECPPSVLLEVQTEEVRSLTRCSGGAVVTLASGQALNADAVVLALGNSPSAVPPFLPPAVATSPRFLKNPWSPWPAELLEENTPLLIVGTGLTMVDKVLELRGLGFKPPIFAISRRGLLPQVHDLTSPPYPDVLPEHWESMSTRGWVRRFRQLIHNPERDWRSVVDGIRPYTQQVWQALPLVEKKRFLRHVRPYWETCRHRMPPEVNETLQGMLQAGQLTLHAGRLGACQVQESSLTFQIYPNPRRTEAKPYELSVGWVLNCSGAGQNFLQRSDPLVQSLLASKLICTDPLGIGLLATAQGELLDSKERASSTLYTLGPPLKGMLWESTAVPEIRSQAEALSRLLIKRIQETVRSPQGESTVSPPMGLRGD